MISKSIQFISVCSKVNKELQSTHTGGCSSYERVKYLWLILRQL